MDARRLRIGDWITGVAGVVLFLSLFAPWYALSDGSMNGWAAFAFTDLWILLTVALAVAVPVVTAAKDSPAVPVALDVVCWAAAAIATLLVLFRLVVEPQSDVVLGREWGVFLGLVAAFATAAGAWVALRDESAPGIRQPAGIELMHAPPPGAGPEPAKQET